MTASKKQAAAYAAYAKQRSENIRAIIIEYKTRRKLTDRDLAELLGISISTFWKRKRNPNLFNAGNLWMLFEALGVPEEQRKTDM